jgi:hypothetical protein
MSGHLLGVKHRREAQKGGTEGRHRREAQKGGTEGRDRREGQKGGTEGRDRNEENKARSGHLLGVKALLLELHVEEVLLLPEHLVQLILLGLGRRLQLRLAPLRLRL